MKSTYIAAACLLAATFAGAAHADDDAGFYVGGGVGQAREKSGDFAGKDTSFRLFAGYSFNRYFAAEAGYIDGGKITDTLDQYDITLDSKGIYATGIGKLPIGKYFVPFVKLGYVYHEAINTIVLGTQRDSVSDSDSDFIFGGGFELKLGESFRVRAEYDKVNLPDAAFDIFSLNAAYKF